jgi:hypothetical protein
VSRYRTVPLDQATEAAWDSLNSNGSFYHSREWLAVLEASFPLHPRHFMVLCDDEPAALCPLFEGRLKGLRGLMAPPYSDYNHLVIAPGHETDELIGQVVARCRELAKEARLGFIQLTARTPEEEALVASHGAVPFPKPGTMVLDLRRHPPGEIWEQRFTSDGGERRTIRKMQKEGFVAEFSQESDDFEEFYDHHQRTLEALGAQAFSRNHFDAIRRLIPPDELVLTAVRKDGTFVAGGLDFVHRPTRTRHFRYMAINRDFAGRYRVFDYLAWKAVEDAGRLGYDRICFGETMDEPGSPRYRSRVRFGAEYRPVYPLIITLRPAARIGYAGWRRLKGARR